VSSPATRTSPSDSRPDQGNYFTPHARHPNLGAQRRARIDVSSTAVRTLPWKLAGNQDVTGGVKIPKQFRPTSPSPYRPIPGAKRRARIDRHDLVIE
jgi:hypothetical protein